MPEIDRSTPSIYLQAKKLVRDAVVALHLEGLNDKELVIRGAPWNMTNIFRGITIWGNKVVDGSQSSNFRNMSGYACVLSMICLDEGSPSGAEINDRFPLWKSNLKRRFHHQQLRGLAFTGATHLCCTVQDSTLRIPDKHPAGGSKFSGDQLIVWYWVREPKDAGT